MFGSIVEANNNKSPDQVALDMIKQKANKNLQIIDNS